jgi:two-component system, LytTR family, response regulator
MPEKIRVLVVEDNKSARKHLISLIDKIDQFYLSGTCSSAEEAFVQISNDMPDMIFLDIELPGKSGLEFLQEFYNRQIEPPEIVFTTAYDKFAIKAIKYSPFDYLLKPVKLEDLQNILLKYASRKNRVSFAQRFANLVSQISESKKLKLNSKNGFTLINPEDILYCEADWNYTTIYLSRNEKEVVSLNIGTVYSFLPEEKFIQVNRSNIINIKYLKRVDFKSRKCILEKNGDTFTLPVSIRNLRRIKRSNDFIDLTAQE